VNDLIRRRPVGANCVEITPVAVAAVPDDGGAIVIVGADVYPEPLLVTVIPVTIPPCDAA
jgi:hypothetical protein